MDNNLVEHYFNIFKEKIESNKQYDFYSHIDFDSFYPIIKNSIIEMIRKNRQNVLTSSFIDYILFPPENFKNVLEKLSGDNEDAFFNVIYLYIMEPYSNYVSGDYKQYAAYMYSLSEDEFNKLRVKATITALDLVKKIGFDLQNQVILLTIIFGVLAECFIERKLSVYNDYLEKLLKDPYSYIDDIKLTDLYNKGDINRRLTSIRILEVFENTRKEIL